MVKSENIKEILDRLESQYPEAECALDHQNVFQLIVAVALSAQTTDKSVNQVTPDLFAKYPDAVSLAAAEPAEVEEYIKRIGMYRTKAKNIVGMARDLVQLHGGQVPEDYDALVALPGVGRKTANVVLAVGFGHQKIAVDTHVFRVSHRIGLASEATSGDAGKAKDAGEKNVLATEQELMKILPEDRWTEAHHSLIWHGRRCCTARNPKCGACPIERHCQKNGV